MLFRRESIVARHDYIVIIFMMYDKWDSLNQSIQLSEDKSEQRFWSGRKNTNTTSAVKARLAAKKKALDGCINHNAPAISDAGR